MTQELPDDPLDPANLPPLAPADDEDRPNPPRFCWLKRGAYLAAAMVLLLALLQVVWNHEAKRRIARFIADAHAHGEPVVFEDFTPPTVPASENAAIPLSEAAEIARHAKYWDTDLVGLLTAEYGPNDFPLPVSKETDDHISKWINTHQGVLERVRSARGRSRVDWGIRFTRPVALQDRRQWDLDYDMDVSDTILLAAFHEHTVGNDAEAIERIRDARFLADAIDVNLATCHTHDYSRIVELFFLRTMRALTPELAVEGVGPTRAGMRPAPRAQVVAVIAEMLDEVSRQKGIERACFGERMVALDSSEVELQRQCGGGVMLAARPLFELDDLRLAEYYSIYVKAAHAPSWPAALAIFPKGKDSFDPYFSDALRFSVFRHYGAPNFREVSWHFQLLTERRIIATMLALRLWSLDHNGDSPALLTELVPAYLPKVPADPFRADGGPIGYLPRKSRPALYSVGANMTDDRGSEIKLPLNSPLIVSGYPWNGLDAVFTLGPDPAGPLPEAEDDNKNAEKNTR